MNQIARNGDAVMAGVYLASAMEDMDGFKHFIDDEVIVKRADVIKRLIGVLADDVRRAAR